MSANIMHESMPCSYLDFSMIFNYNTTSLHPMLGVATNCIGCPLIIRNFYALKFNTMLKILEPTSSKLIPRQFLKSVRSPFFGKGTSFDLVHSSCINFGSSIYSLMKTCNSRHHSSSNDLRMFGDIPLSPRLL